MKSILVIVVAFLLCANAQAQLRKCIGPDGKVTYSDVLCDSRAATGSIKNPNGNTLDASAARKHAQDIKDAQESQLKKSHVIDPIAIYREEKWECDAALRAYKKIMLKRQDDMDVITKAEAAAVNAKCGPGTVPESSNIRMFDQNGNRYRVKIR